MVLNSEVKQPKKRIVVLVPMERDPAYEHAVEKRRHATVADIGHKRTW